MKDFQQRLLQAYKKPTVFLGRPLVTFRHTTNPRFTDRIGSSGHIYLDNPIIQYTSFRRSMHTSYVISITYTKYDNRLVVTTRNSTYIFVPHESLSSDFTWTLSQDIQDEYEKLIQGI